MRGRRRLRAGLEVAMTEEHLAALIVAAGAALFGLLTWTVRRVVAAILARFGADQQTIASFAAAATSQAAATASQATATAELATAVRELRVELRALDGRVLEVRDEVRDLTPPPVDITRDDTPVQVPRPIQLGRRYSQRGQGGKDQ